MTTAIISAVAEIFGLFAIGAIARFSGYIQENEIDRWSRFVLDFLYPLYIFTSITRGFQTEHMHELWPLPVIGFGLVLLGATTGGLLRHGLLTKDSDIRRSFIHFCAVNNSAYLPIVIINNIWGDTALANLFFLNLGTTFGIWTIGVAVLGASSLKGAYKSIFSPNLFGVLAALFFCLTGTGNKLPPLFVKIISTAGSAAVPVILVLIGASLAQKSALRVHWPVVYVTIVRLILLPLISIGILKLLPITHEVYSVAVMVSLMPVAVASVIMTRRYGGSPDYAASAALITTICAIFTVPFGLGLLF